jgi:hypothetical protein
LAQVITNIRAFGYSCPVEQALSILLAQTLSLTTHPL